MNKFFVTEPNVYLISEQSINESQLQSFLDDHDFDWGTRDKDLPAGETLIEQAGRLCYLSYSNPKNKTNDEYIKHIVSVGHGSVLEHAVFTFAITGISRALSHELVRHRVGMSPSQLSQRYVPAEQSRMIIPPLLAGSEEAERIFQKIRNDHIENYNLLYNLAAFKLKENNAKLSNTMIAKNVRQVARYATPNAAETMIDITINARALRHLFGLRANPAADLEIRKLAVKMWKLVIVNHPNLFNDFKLITLEDGTEGLHAEKPHV